MSSNNLYDTLIQMARQENIQPSETQSSRQTEVEPVSEFNMQIKTIRQGIQSVNRTNAKIIGMKNKLASTAVPAQQLGLLKQIQNMCDSNYEAILQVKGQLQKLTEIVKKTQNESPEQPETHAQIYQKQSMIYQVNNMITSTQQVQKLIQNYSINTSMNRIKALAPDMSDSEARDIAMKKNGFDQLIMQKTLGQASLKLKYTLQDIEQKNMYIKKLEQSIKENKELMDQIAFLVNQQGQMIDNIHDNIINAKDYIQKAQAVLHKQKKQSKKSRKKLCCIILVGIVILALILVPIILTVVNNNKAKTTT